MLEAYGSAFGILFTPPFLPLLALLLGTGLGLISGAMPAGGLPVLVVMLGFAYHLDPYIAIPIVIGHMAVNGTTDPIPCILMGIPGSSSAQATILDGYPMAKQGMAGQALAAAYFASLLGGLIGALGLALVIPLARPIINFFGSPEFFMMALLGIAIVGIVSSGALVKGLLAGAFGLSLGLVGFDSIAGIPRGTLGIDYLWDGLPLIPAIIGLFAIPELLDMVVSDTPIARRRMDELVAGVNTGRLEGIRMVLRHKLLVLRSSLVGLLVGIMPGVGGSTAHWLAYAQARQSERDAYKTFGTGDVRGVIAPESANNSIDGGVLIPTLTFGLPGSAGMAIMLGFLVLLGIQPGPEMLGKNVHITVLIAVCLALANVVATLVALFFTPQLAKISTVPPNVLVPLVVAMLTLSAFQARASVGDLLAVAVFAGIGWYMKRYGWPRPPIVIALVLGEQMEKYLWLSVNTYGWSMLARPQVLVLLAITIVSVYSTLRLERRTNREIALSTQDVSVPTN